MTSPTQNIEQLGAQLVLTLQQFTGSQPSVNADKTVSALYKQVKTALPNMQQEALQTLLIINNVVKVCVDRGVVTPQVGSKFFAMLASGTSQSAKAPAKPRSATNTGKVASIMQFPGNSAADNIAGLAR